MATLPFLVVASGFFFISLKVDGTAGLKTAIVVMAVRRHPVELSRP